MLSTPTADQVRALATDPGAARTAEGLANRRQWSATARNERAVWGLCQGSGSAPYQVGVDLGGPAFKCSCPSRKFPCKHGLAILFLLAANPGDFSPGEPPGWLTEWLASREQRASVAEARAARPPEVDKAGRQKRVEARERKVDAGVEELDRWLRDLVRRGLAAAKGEGYAFWDAAGARLVDAQAASLGREVRTLGAIANGGGAWAERALEQVARLHLVVEAYRRLDELPEPLRDDVRSLVGWTVKEDDLPTDTAVADRWLAVGRTVDADERLTTVRTWLLGEASGRFALHLAFAPGGSIPAPLAVPGGSFRGDLVFYPSATPLRATLSGAPGPAAAVTTLPTGGDIAAAAVAMADVLARNPFVRTWPVVLADVIPTARGAPALRDAAGATVPVVPAAAGTRLLASAGGHPVAVVGLWTGRSIRVLSALADGRLVDLATDGAGSWPESEPAPATDDAWGRLVSAALLGTERADPPELDLGEGLGDVGQRQPEARVLAATAIVTMMRRAGWQPAVDDSPPPEPAAADPRPAVGPSAAWLLRRAIEERPDLVPEWLRLAVAGNRRPPDDELPSLLGLASRSPEVRATVEPLLGPRATWLVEQLPELAPSPEDHGLTPREDWDAARGAAARGAIIGRLRERDPAALRTLVAEVWEGAAVDERAATVRALLREAEPDDEALLETALRDRSGEVRWLAAQALARIPGSALARTLETKARGVLRPAGRIRLGLDADLPAWDDDLDAMRLIRKAPAGWGERAWWLRQVVTLVPPDRWPNWLNESPPSLVARAARSDEARAILEGWAEATVASGDSAWAAALLGEDRVVGGEVAPGVDVTALLAALPAGEREAWVARRLGSVAVDVAARFAATCPGPWSDALAGVVAKAIAKAGEAAYPDQGFYDLLRIAVRRVPPARADDLEAVLFDDDRRRLSVPVTDAVEILRFRAQMSAAFATDR